MLVLAIVDPKSAINDERSTHCMPKQAAKRFGKAPLIIEHDLGNFNDTFAPQKELQLLIWEFQNIHQMRRFMPAS